MCRAVSLLPCSTWDLSVDFLRVSVGVWGGGAPCPASLSGQEGYLFIHFGNNCVKMAPWAPAGRERERQRMEGVRLGGACMAANLLHMEEMAFPCKMCFSSCVSPVLMMMNLSTFPLSLSLSLPALSVPLSFLSLWGRKTANRHQGSSSPLL